DEHDDGLEFALRLEAPEFVFEARVDCGATAATAAAALLIEDFAGAELDVDEVVPGTERGRGVPKTADDQEEFEDHVEDLLEKGFVNPPGLPSALIHTTGWHTQSRLGPDSEQLSEGRLLKRAPPTEDGPQAIDPD
ncbi:MAG: hypothetical protein GWN07_07120, partial [Actinobacteria bacterium]|nr:hypothetical protein [Actinomycetota bacterium]NIX19609.1 hypothetical protein [Actinomycetota bacterium]